MIKNDDSVKSKSNFINMLITGAAKVEGSQMVSACLDRDVFVHRLLTSSTGGSCLSALRHGHVVIDNKAFDIELEHVPMK